MAKLHATNGEDCGCSECVHIGTRIETGENNVLGGQCSDSWLGLLSQDDFASLVVQRAFNSLRM